MKPHRGRPWTSTATFFANGAVNTIQLASPSLYTLTYGLDSEGRWDTLEDGSTMIVTGPTNGTMYDAAGHVLNVQLTGATPDQDIYTYDPNTGNMKTFEFEVGNTPANLTGAITWNPNGTLAHVAVVDGFNSGGSSTCYSDSNSWLGYGYDDWGRLLAFDCGSGNVAEYMQPDIYDNVKMTVPSSRTGWTFTPGYNSSNNQVTGNTYDSNGNTTADGGSNTYGYNEFSQVKWAATSGTPTCGSSGKCVTYDAFGRMVENSNSTAWVELWYPQVPGARVTMNGTTQSFAYWPSPGRGTYIESSTKTFIHPDWLGNDRIVSAFGSHAVNADRDYTPYGQQFNSFGSANPIYGIFAGMSGDYDSGTLFDTPNREFAVNQLRWTSPDPAGAGWNQYAYPTNPNSFTDPAGLDSCWDHSSYEGSGSPPPCNLGGGPAGPGGAGCMMDGAPVDCGIMNGAINMGAAETCPNNNCGPYVGSNGLLYLLFLDQDGWGYINSRDLTGDPFSDGSEYGLPALPDDSPDYSLGGAANNGPDPGAVLNSMKQYVKAQISNCYNGFHQTTFGKGVQAFSALALFPVASNYQSNQLATGAEVVGKVSVVLGSNSAGGVFAPLLESFTSNVTTPLVVLGTGADAGAYLLCAAGAATSIHP